MGVDRNYSIDTLRTISTILVIIIHVCAPVVTNSDTNSNLFWISNLLDSFSRVSVPIFVLISGYFLLNNKSFPIKRYLKILWPLIFWTSFYLLYNHIPLYLKTQEIFISEIFHKLIYGVPYYHLWYVYMLLGLYGITPLLIKYFAPLSSTRKLTLISIFFLFGILLRYLCFIYSFELIFIFQFLEYVGYYALGGWLKTANIRNFKKYLYFYILFSLSTSILVYQFNSFYFYEYLSLNVILATISIFIFFSQVKLKENFLSKISPLTFGVYLVHPFILNRLQKLNLNFSILELIVMCSLLSVMIIYFFNKVPILKKVI